MCTLLGGNHQSDFIHVLHSCSGVEWSILDDAEGITVLDDTALCCAVLPHQGSSQVYNVFMYATCMDPTPAGDFAHLHHTYPGLPTL